MSVQPRPYQDADDLLAIGRLIRHAYAQTPGWNAWSFCRWDIWAQRALADERVHERTYWQPGIQLWHDEAGELAGAVWMARHEGVALASDPNRPEMNEILLDWALEHFAELAPGDTPLIIEATDANPALAELLAGRKFARPEDHMIHRRKTLAGTADEPVTLPAGYRVKPIQTLAELEAFHRAVAKVFGFKDSVPVYEVVRQAPSFRADLDLVLLSDRDEVAAFCTAWLDQTNNVAEFEPVGTVPEFRRRGLAHAVLAAAHNRLRALNCAMSTVHSYSESAGASATYGRAGLEPHVRSFGWRRPA